MSSAECSDSTSFEPEISSVFQDLNATGRKRYLEKLAFVGKGVQDPYLHRPTAASSDEPLVFVPVEYGDVYNFLINAPSPYTKEELKAFKSLEGYQFFLSGWVGKLRCFNATEDGSRVFATAHVRHSQSVSSAELLPWVALAKDGTVMCAHCTCMAGLGEACSHIAALLFVLVSRTSVTQDKSCTSVPCQWRRPHLQDVPYARVVDIDFTAPPTAQRRQSVHDSDTPRQEKHPMPAGSCAPTSSELTNFFTRLSGVSKPAVLSIVPGFSAAYVPKKPTGLPSLLTDLYDESMLGASFTSLLVKCEELFHTIAVTDAAVKNLEMLTRDQASSKDWFLYRAGRITASKFRAAAHTDVSQPSSSLVRSICYPEAFRFSTVATRWGCKHEADARAEYAASRKLSHQNLSVVDSGLVVPTSHPYLGASPDGIVSCDCCGMGVIEVKCPFSCRDKEFADAAESSKFCLESSVDGFK